MTIAQFHDDLRSYGNLEDREKPLIVAGILFALHHGLSIFDLKGDTTHTDGQVIYDVIEKNTCDKTVLEQLSLFKINDIINTHTDALAMTPIRYFTMCVNEYKDSMNMNEDFLGAFYTEFIRYSGGDGQNLGIILTPKFVTDLCKRILDIKPTDTVLDPCMGTGAFLHETIDSKIIGIELRPYIYTLAYISMQLKGKQDAKLYCADAFETDVTATIGLMNPPYAQGSKKASHLYEANFIKMLLEKLTTGGKAAVIVPRSTFTLRDKERTLQRNILLQNNTLEGVITLSGDSFLRIGTTPCIAVFTAGIPHPAEHICRFIDFTEDGCENVYRAGRLATEETNKKMDDLVEVWNGKPSQTKIETTITTEDEWLYSFFHEKTDIPSLRDFEKTVEEYMLFKVNSTIVKKKGHIFMPMPVVEASYLPKLDSRKWRMIPLVDIFEITGARKTKTNEDDGQYPYITAMSKNNGVYKFTNFHTEDGQCITVESAANGYAAYQEYPFATLDHVEKLEPNFKTNLYIGLFIVTVLNCSHKNKFSYGFKASKKRLLQESIYLPVKEDDTCDFAFMEKFIGILMQQTRDELKLL